MPIVNVKTWPLKEEEKEKLIEGIDKVFRDLGIEARVMTTIEDIPLENWGTDGVQHSKKYPKDANLEKRE